MPERICAIDGCERAAHARGWCPVHYGKWRHYGDPIHELPRLTGVPCSISGCEAPVVGRGWCSMHWTRWQKHGDPKYSRERTPACAVDGCDKLPRSAFAEFCEMHYGRMRRNGTTDARELLERYTDDRGYVLVKRAGHPMADTRGYVYEHRLVAAEKLGRILESSEYVHHIDGTTTNNDPDNLVVVNGSQHSRIHWLERRGTDLRLAVEIVLAN